MNGITIVLCVLAALVCHPGLGGASLARAQAAPEAQADRCADALRASYGPLGRPSPARVDSMLAMGRDRHANPRARRGDGDQRMDKGPEILRMDPVHRAMEDLYPPELRGRNPGGTTHVLMLVGPDSVPQSVEVVQASGQFPFDVATVRLMGRTRISPGIYQGCPVWAAVTFPVEWEPSRR